MTTLTIDGRSINVKLTYLHVVPVAENLSGGPPSVAARLGHIMTDYIWWTLAVHFESQANIKGCIFLQMKEQREMDEDREFCSLKKNVKNLGICSFIMNGEFFQEQFNFKK